MMYSSYAKNYEQDKIFYTRLRLIEKLNIDINKSAAIYTYYMNAHLGILL